VRRLTVLRGFYAIPSPPGAVPIHGHILHVMMHGPARAHELFLRWHEAYGPTLRIRLLHRTLVLIADAGDAAQVLGKGPNECFARTPEYTTFDVVRRCWAGGQGTHCALFCGARTPSCAVERVWSLPAVPRPAHCLAA
jgi:hypothetical protein